MKLGHQDTNAGGAAWRNGFICLPQSNTTPDLQCFIHGARWCKWCATSTASKVTKDQFKLAPLRLQPAITHTPSVKRSYSHGSFFSRYSIGQYLIQAKKLLPASMSVQNNTTYTLWFWKLVLLESMAVRFGPSDLWGSSSQSISALWP